MQQSDIEALAQRLAEILRAELTSVAGTELAGEWAVLLRPYLERLIPQPAQGDST